MQYIIQPNGLSNMVVNADKIEATESATHFIKDGRIILVAPHVNTKYIGELGSFSIKNHK